MIKKLYFFENDRIANIFLCYGNLKFHKEIKNNSLIIYKNIKINEYILNILLNDLKKDNHIFIRSTFLYNFFQKFAFLNKILNLIHLLDIKSDYFHKNIKKITSDLEFNNEFKNINFKNLYKSILSQNKYICFSFRDHSYLKEKFKKDFSYHSYRDFDPKNLINALNYISKENNWFCVRMGKIVSSKLTNNNEQIIDYAFNYQNDSDDILLYKNCFLNICDSSGIIYLGLLNNRNTLRINCNINDLNKPQNNTISLLVKYFDLSLNRYLTYKEAINRDVMKFKKTSDFINNDIKIIPNTTNEIIDTLNLLITKKVISKKIDDMSFNTVLSDKLHNNIFEYASNISNNYKSRYSLKYKSKISEVFLSKNIKLLD